MVCGCIDTTTKSFITEPITQLSKTKESMFIPKYEVYQDRRGEFRFRLKDDNGKIIAVSEGYKQHAGCINGINSVKANCNTHVEDTTLKAKALSNPKYKVMVDKDGQYRYVLVARNGEPIMFDVGYDTKANAMKGIEVVKASCDAEVDDPWAEKEPPAAAEVTTTPPMTGTVETVLTLNKLPETANKGDMLMLTGKLAAKDTGQGVSGASVAIMEHDRSFAIDEFLEEGGTSGDGSFSIEWKVRKTDWWDNTSEIYADFRGNEEAKPSRSEIQKLKVK